MKTISIREIKPSDEIRVSNRRMHATGTVKKVNRVNLIIASSVWGNPVEYSIRKDELIGGQLANASGLYTITD